MPILRHEITVTGICEALWVTEEVVLSSVIHMRARNSQAHSNAAQQRLTIGTVAWVQHGFKIDLVPHISSSRPKAVPIPAWAVSHDLRMLNM